MDARVPVAIPVLFAREARRVMKTLFRFFVLVLLIGGWGLAALSVHVVPTPGEIPVTVVTKDRLCIRDIYVDTTKWTMDDVPKHPAVVERLIESGKADVLKHVVDPKGGDVEAQLSGALGLEAEPDERDVEGMAGRMARRAGFRWPWEK